MARTEIPVTTIARAGVEPVTQTDSDATNGMLVASNNGRVFVEIESADAGPQDVDFLISVLVDGQTVVPRTVTIPAGETRLVGPFPQSDYNQDDRSLYIDPAVDTTLKFRAYMLPGS